MSDTEVFKFDHKEAIRQIERAISKLKPPKRVLLVDDDEADIILNTRLLKKFKVELAVCNVGQDAITRLREKEYDLVLFDLVMPPMDGLKLMMDAAGLQRGTHFILVTGFPSSPNVDAVLRLGAVMLPKPLTEHSLELIGLEKIELPPP